MKECIPHADCDEILMRVTTLLCRSVCDRLLWPARHAWQWADATSKHSDAKSAGREQSAPYSDQLDPDSDGDGLSDFQEVHKYRTDPKNKDTAGKGVSDGQWEQRREFTYSVRAVIRVMRPYNVKALNDDYQDVRVLAENKEYAELEVVVYPLNSNAEAIKGNRELEEGLRRHEGVSGPRHHDQLGRSRCATTCWANWPRTASTRIS